MIILSCIGKLEFSCATNSITLIITVVTEQIALQLHPGQNIGFKLVIKRFAL